MMDSASTDLASRLCFAVTEQARGIAIFSAAPEGLRCRLSRDGVLWKTEVRSWEDAGRLWPICAGEPQEQADLFCVDDAGRVFPVKAAEGDLFLSPPFQPVASAQRWYESPPQPHDMAIVRDVRGDVYRAFFCARRTLGRHSERRACIGAATSPDLQAWGIEPPIFSPNKYPYMYSPHVFVEQGRAILLYATPEPGNLRGLRSALAPDLEGPYEMLAPDLLSCDARTAVRTVRLRSRRLVFFSRSVPDGEPGERISRPGQLDFHANGAPFVRFYDPLLGLLGHSIFDTEASLESGEILVRMLPRHARDFRLTARVRSLGAKRVGLLFRTTAAGHDNITLWLEFDTGGLTLRRGVIGRHLARTRRRLLEGTNYKIAVWAEGAFADVYVDDEWVLTCQTETRRLGGFGLAVSGGQARFDGMSVQGIHSS